MWTTMTWGEIAYSYFPARDVSIIEGKFQTECRGITGREPVLIFLGIGVQGLWSSILPF
jgi:hypothetical protein